MATAQPLLIKNCSGDDVPVLMSKGHHDNKPFLAAARTYWGEPLKGWDGPYRSWWRAAPDSTGDYRCMYHEAKPNSRGAFAVTFIYRP